MDKGADALVERTVDTAGRTGSRRRRVLQHTRCRQLAEKRLPRPAHSSSRLANPSPTCPRSIKAPVPRGAKLTPFDTFACSPACRLLVEMAKVRLLSPSITRLAHLLTTPILTPCSLVCPTVEEPHEPQPEQGTAVGQERVTSGQVEDSLTPAHTSLYLRVLDHPPFTEGSP